MSGLISVLGAIVFIGYGIMQIYAGYLGIEEYWGMVAAIAVIFISSMMRITIPILVGGFLCATELWGWHWIWAVIFVMPGILFMVPSLLTTVFARRS